MMSHLKKSLLTVMITAIAVIGFGFSASAQVVTPDTGNIVLKSDGDFVFTFDYTGTVEDSVDIKRLEVDHSLQGVLPEFHLAADEEDPYDEAGDQVKFQEAGVEVTFSGKKWTITFKKDGIALGKILENNGITFYLALIDSGGEKVWGSMEPVTEANTFDYSISRELEIQIITNPAGDTTFEVDNNSSFEMRIKADGRDKELVKELEVDHSMQGMEGVPEFSIYAGSTAEEIWGGSQQLELAESLGVSATYANNEWVINFGSSITQKILENNGITFYLAFKDKDKKYVFGDMNSITPANTFKYDFVKKQTPPSSVRGSSGGSRPVQKPTTPETPELPATPTTPEDKVKEIQKYADALVPNARGESVAMLQAFLNANGFGPLAVDGISGPMTRAALDRYMNSININTSTTIEFSTNTNIRIGDRNRDVSSLQAILNQKGFNVGVADGIFGPRTMAQVRAFQAANGLVADGIVGPATRAALNK